MVVRFMISDGDFTRRMLETVLTVTAVLLVLAALWAAHEALILIYISAIIAMGFAPIVQFLQHPRTRAGTRIPRAFAILVVYLTIIGALVLLGLMVVPPLVDQAARLWSDMPRYFDRFQPTHPGPRYLSGETHVYLGRQYRPRHARWPGPTRFQCRMRHLRSDRKERSTILPFFAKDSPGPTAATDSGRWHRAISAMTSIFRR